MRLSLGLILTTSAFAISAGLASPAFAQEGAAGDPPDPACANLPEGEARDKCISGEVEIESGQAATEGEGTIIVTGSRIRRPNVQSPVPITSVSAEELTEQGDVNVGDALNDLPSLRSTFSQANSTRFIGTSGLNILDLRGLGTSRTLVLVNSRRHITASVGDFQVDVNTIPTDLLERVDVVTGGNSAVYGSDAVAGVVNFITKRNFDGYRLRGQAGSSSRGDRGIQFLTLTAGKNLFEDRANVAINLEYVNADPLYFTQRPGLTGAADGRCQFNASEFTIGEPQSGDGVPDQTFFCGVRNAALSVGGTVAPLGVSAAVCSNPTVLANPTLAARCLNPGTPQGQPRMFRFDRFGNLLQDIPSLDFRPFGSGNIISDPNSTVPGTTLRETGQLAPGLDRYTANLLAHFDISDAFKPFVEAKYVHIKSLQEFQPSFIQGGLLGTFRCNNPFLTAQALAGLQAIGRCATPATGTFPVSRFNVDLGGRIEKDTRETYRVVGGVEGTFNDDWRYEVALNYGHFKQRGRHLNDLQLLDIDGNFAGWLLAIDAVTDGSGNIVCRVNADADPSNDAPGCVPINVFGHEQPSQAAIDFVNVTSRLNQKASQYNAVAYLGGDMSQLFELPGGAPRFVVGGEYRKETAYFKADPLSSSGATFFNAFQEFDPPALVVKELFGELEIPVFRDQPFFHELTFAAAGRQSWYNKGAGGARKTFAYNVNGVWAPVRDLRFRGNYSKAVRVPTLSDLFFPPTQNFAQLLDPCDVARIGPPGTNRFNNCQALGVPPGFVATFTNSQTAEIISSGNPFLTEETGKSLTLGGVVTPRWIPGLSVSVDYYRIRVNNLISVLGGQTILNQCVDLPDIGNQFCQLIFPRQTVDDPTTVQNDIGALQNPALISAGVNFAKQEADGIDFELTYRKNFANGHRLNLIGRATYVLKRNNYLSPTNPNFRDVQLHELGDPEWAANGTIVYGFGPLDLRYTLNYIGRQTIGAYENYFGVQDRPPQNADLTRERWFPDVLYHAVRANMRIKQGGRDRINVYGGIDNLFDTKPPLGQLGTGGGDPFDAIGRYFYAGATVDF